MMQASSSPSVRFTVFTPTFNRAHTLDRVHRSLRAQTFDDFEWLIVDDGSTDGTAGVVSDWTAHAPFAIRYLRQEHGGKHVAFNRGVEAARGELFVTLDSDDECVPEALERFDRHWRTLSERQQTTFCGVTGLCVDQHGALVGDRFPADPTDSNALEIRYRLRISGEKWGFNRTAVLRSFPFPELHDQPNVTESVVWNRIARQYQTRYVNEVLRVYHRHEDGPSLTESAKQRLGRASMFALKNRLVLEEEIEWFTVAPATFLRAAANYARFSWHEGIGVTVQNRRLRGRRARLLHALAAPFALAVRWQDHRAGQRIRVAMDDDQRQYRTERAGKR